MESDWKKFTAMVPTLRERYLAEYNARIAALLQDGKKNETDRFWEAMELMEKEARVLRQCLNGHSRSKLRFFILAMMRAGMLGPENLKVFSDELQKSVSHVMDGLPQG